MEFKTQKFVNNNFTLVSNKLLEIPKLCPICGVSNNPSTSYLGASSNIAFFYHHCTSCENKHYTLQKYENDYGSCISLYPNQQPSNFPKQVDSFSKRFVKMYHDAEFAEQSNSIELAGIGYRAALEILLKDYALEFKLDTYEEIAKTNLNNAISKYFKTDVDSQTAADVVRILGNDYAHWEQNEESDIEMLKAYLNIFIQIVNTKLMLKNPPVSRQKKSD